MTPRNTVLFFDITGGTPRAHIECAPTEDERAAGDVGPYKKNVRCGSPVGADLPGGLKYH